MAAAKHLRFGPHKYAALDMILAKWLRAVPLSSPPFCYVTLGGTELDDVAHVSWIDKDLTRCVLSYEQDRARYVLAHKKAEYLRTKGVDVTIVREDIFRYRRSLDVPHIFYLDLLGNCKPDPYRREFKIWFENNVIQPGDLVLVTSYLGRNPGWERVLQPFDSEFRLLRIGKLEEKKRIYEIVHPVFVLGRALLDAGLRTELRLRCLGSIVYRDSSMMGLYGILCEEGSYDLATAISKVSCFKTTSRDWTTLPAW